MRLTYISAAQETGYETGYDAGIEHGEAKGRAKGRAEGRLEGRVEGKINSYRDMLASGLLTLEQIKKSGKLTAEEIELLQH